MDAILTIGTVCIVAMLVALFLLVAFLSLLWKDHSDFDDSGWQHR